jgi:hypothetical protein
MGFMVGKSSAKPSLKLHLSWLGMQPLYQDVKICDLGACFIRRISVASNAIQTIDNEA